MREKLRDKGRIEDIIKYSENIRKMIEGVSFEKFQDDILIYYAVMKNVEIVGEAAFMLSAEFKEAHPKTPWKVVQGMRHYLVHGYANIDIHELYSTAVNDIPILREQAEEYLAGTSWDEWEKE
ncbi:MAG: DUF86 domain-containing protein [Prevotella sp.]|nr:DUF86 domain-containing protein [Prevotella sp.]